MSAEDRSVPGPVDVVGHVGRPVDARDAGRRCSHPGCHTILSRYNPDDNCNAHGGWSDATVKRPGRKAGSDSGARAADVADGPEIIDLRDD
ncbi:MAG TPA: hypothetical protein VMM13_17650 [Euzebya sp.]|nr:hypothetical protein [Euzebya sp.]